MAVHPKEELLIHILDPSRSVEGNYVQYTVATADGRVLNGLLASETRTADRAARRRGQAARRAARRDRGDGRLGQVAHARGVREAGPARADLADLLAFLTQRGKYLPLDLGRAATVVSTQGDVLRRGRRRRAADLRRLGRPRRSRASRSCWSTRRAAACPTRSCSTGREGTIPPRMPQSVALPCNAPAQAIHLLSGVQRLGALPRPRGARLADRPAALRRRPDRGPSRCATASTSPTTSGRVDVPGPKPAFLLGDQQVRYLAIRPKRSRDDRAHRAGQGPGRRHAPFVMAVTVATGE